MVQKLNSQLGSFFGRLKRRFGVVDLRIKSQTILLNQRMHYRCVTSHTAFIVLVAWDRISG